MKDAEDEAFDELAKRQGAWGGGYRAKKTMAADKLKVEDDDTQVYKRPWVGLTDEEIEDCVHHVDDEAVFGLPDFARAVEQLLKEKNNGP